VHQHGGEVGADAPDLLEGRDLSIRSIAGRGGQSCLALGLQFSDEFQHEREPSAQTIQLSPQQRR